jgi:hypothetical protein
VINKDREAPFFRRADYGVVGDLHEVIPALISEIRGRKSTMKGAVRCLPSGNTQVGPARGPLTETHCPEEQKRQARYSS